jgi:MinD superfamily P-loop ATPase
VREIVVLSGKGGTGKTSMVAAFAALAAEPLVLGDCDVDAANLALLHPGEALREEPFFAGRRARIDAAACTGCMACVEACRYRALALGPVPVPLVDDLACEGCGACAVVCQFDAVGFVPNRSGTVYVSDAAAGALIHGALGIAQDNSGKLVARVRELAREAAGERGCELVLLDGPPGIGCPVHAALGGVSLVVAVTEPTLSGRHDLERLFELCAHFDLECAVLVNKHDLAPTVTEQIEGLARERGARLLGRVPFDEAVPRAVARGESPLAVPRVRAALERAWERIDRP